MKDDHSPYKPLWVIGKLHRPRSATHIAMSDRDFHCLLTESSIKILKKKKEKHP